MDHSIHAPVLPSDNNEQNLTSILKLIEHEPNLIPIILVATLDTEQDSESIWTQNLGSEVYQKFVVEQKIPAGRFFLSQIDEIGSPEEKHALQLEFAEPLKEILVMIQNCR